MNVIAIAIDTLRHDIIGPNAPLRFVQTPNLDRFASDAVVFDNAFGECQPTLQVRRAWFTGRRSFPFSHNFDRRGHWGHRPGWHKIPPEEETLAEILLRRGYYTGFIADTYHMFKPSLNYHRGFLSWEFVRGQQGDSWKAGPPELVADQMKRYTRDPENVARNAMLYQYLLNRRGNEAEENFPTARVFRRAAEWIEENGTNKPFFLWVDAFSPHEPFDSPGDYADTYCADYEGLDYIMPEFVQGGFAPDEIHRVKALYFGLVTFVDRWVGHLLDKIDSLGIGNDTLIAIMSDHGTELWDHGTFVKGFGNMRAYTTKTVWMMRGPGLPGPRHVEPFVQTHDFMPTVLDLAGIRYDRMEGKSVMPLVRGETDSHREPIVIGWSETCDGKATGYASVRTKRWNYTTDLAQPGNHTLYDLSADPLENDNVVADHPNIVRDLRLEIEAVAGQPLPLRMNEVCDSELSPLFEFLRTRESGAMNE